MHFFSLIFFTFHFEPFFCTFCTFLQFFCTCVHCPVRVVFALLMSVTQPEDAVFHPSVEEQLKKYKDPKSARSFLSRAAGRAVAHIDAVISRASEQWEFYKQVRILNPTKLPDLDHDLKNLTALQFPMDDAEFRAQWHTYCRVENHSIDSPSALALFWANQVQSGVMPKPRALSKGGLRTTSLVSMLRLERIV